METEEFQQQVKLEYYKSGVQVVREIGVMALRTIITLNSGAFVVLLTFIGNTAAQSRFSVPVNDLKLAMFCFLTGITLAFISIAYTYVAAQKVTPYPTQSESTDGWFIPIIVCITALAFFAFLAGVAVVVCGVQTAI